MDASKQSKQSKKPKTLETVSSRDLKKGLVHIKKGLTKNIGPVWKRPKNDVVDILKSLKYSYDNKDHSLRASKQSAMKRLPTHIKLKDL